MISPITRLLLVGAGEKSRIWCSLHSKLTGDSATRGGRTIVDVTGVTFASSNSLTDESYSPLVAFIGCSNSKVTMLTTNSFVSRTLRSVSFASPCGPFPFFGGRRPGAKASNGGSTQTALKKENGARFGCPAALSVETHAMGRGATELRTM